LRSHLHTSTLLLAGVAVASLTACQKGWVVETLQPGPRVELWDGDEVTYTLTAEWTVSDVGDVYRAVLELDGVPEASGGEAMLELCEFGESDGVCHGSLVTDGDSYSGFNVLTPNELEACAAETGVCTRTYTVRFISTSSGPTAWRWEARAAIEGLSEASAPEGMHVALTLER